MINESIFTDSPGLHRKIIPCPTYILQLPGIVSWCNYWPLLTYTFLPQGVRNCARSLDSPPWPINPTCLYYNDNDSAPSCNLQRCCRKSHHRTTLGCPAGVGASGHSLLPLTGLLRSDRKEKALPALCSPPTPQIQENSHRRAILALANPLFVFQEKLSSPVLGPSQVSGEWRTVKKVQSEFGICGAELKRETLS